MRSGCVTNVDYGRPCSWLWIPKTWTITLPVLFVLGAALGILIAPILFWSVILVGVPLIVVPVTYRSLVHGGCNIRFHICPLAKGVFAGFAMYLLTLLADSVVGTYLLVGGVWEALRAAAPISNPYQVWWLSGLVGGVLARINEVRDSRNATPMIVVSHMEPDHTPE